MSTPTSSSFNNTAAWIPFAHTPFKIGQAPIPEPTDLELLIRIHAIAINPVDAIIQKTGVIQSTYPAIVGCDCAGEVIRVGGAATSRFQPGDRVLAACAPSIYFPAGPKRDNWGTFQYYVAAKAATAVKIPPQVSFREASVLPLGTYTAAIALFSKERLGLKLPRLEPEPNGQSVLIWSGSSSVGMCAIQLAKAAGYTVATTCSPRNFEACKDAGADYVFDYRDKEVVGDIVKTLRGKQSAGALVCHFGVEGLIGSGQVVSRLDGAKKLNTVFASAEQMAHAASEAVEKMPEGVKVMHGKAPDC